MCVCGPAAASIGYWEVGEPLVYRDVIEVGVDICMTNKCMTLEAFDRMSVSPCVTAVFRLF